MNETVVIKVRNEKMLTGERMWLAFIKRGHTPWELAGAGTSAGAAVRAAAEISDGGRL